MIGNVYHNQKLHYRFVCVCLHLCCRHENDIQFVDCVANGDSDGENDGDIADDVLKPAIDASWLIGDRGNSGYWTTEPE